MNTFQCYTATKHPYRKFSNSEKSIPCHQIPHRIYSIPKTNHTRNLQISRFVIKTMKTNMSTTSLSKKMRLQQQLVEESATYWARNWRTGPEESDRRSRRRGPKSGRREGEEGRLRRSRLRRRRRCLSLAGVSSANMAAARRSEAVSDGGLSAAAIIPTISAEGRNPRRRTLKASSAAAAGKYFIQQRAQPGWGLR